MPGSSSRRERHRLKPLELIVERKKESDLFIASMSLRANLGWEGGWSHRNCIYFSYRFAMKEREFYNTLSSGGAVPWSQAM